jgi:predicted CXXCH cytochrome family protein
MKRRLLLAGVMGLTACATLFGVFVDRSDHIKAPHARHKAADVDCSTCHETIFDSTALTTVDLPKEKVCLGCHKEQKQQGECSFCHTQPDKPLPLTGHARALKMNHQDHIERVKEDCAVCHTSLPEPLRTDAMAPPMSVCLGCHEHQAQWDRGDCEVCHEDLSKYGPKPMEAFSHQGDWLKTHAFDARASGQVCTSCHEQTFCADCHIKTEGLRVDRLMPERVDRAFVHRNDFLSRHSIEASGDQASCLRCHGTDFCQSCHLKNGLTPGAPNGFNPHPSGFGQGAEHGAAARRDIVSCASCHDQGAASICVTCHTVGGVGGSPHPPSWLMRHDHQEIGKNAMCQVCHH